MSNIGITNKQLTSFLDGRWHSGNGFLCVGTFRIARADFEFGVLGTTENQNKFIDKIADRLNDYSTLADDLSLIRSLLEQVSWLNSGDQLSDNWLKEVNEILIKTIARKV